MASSMTTVRSSPDGDPETATNRHRQSNRLDFNADQKTRKPAKRDERSSILNRQTSRWRLPWPSQNTGTLTRAQSVERRERATGKRTPTLPDAAGIRFARHLSPWDRNHAGDGRPVRRLLQRPDIRETSHQYGPIFEMWFDGASGGDGYYGGQGGTRQIDYNTYYDWKGVRALDPRTAAELRHLVRPIPRGRPAGLGRLRLGRLRGRRCRRPLLAHLEQQEGQRRHPRLSAWSPRRRCLVPGRRRCLDPARVVLPLPARTTR